MTFAEYFPIWNKLTSQEQSSLSSHATLRRIKAGEMVHNGSMHCTGLLLLASGQLRGYILSPQGREITLYRLLEGDLCLFSASCMMSSIQFDITIQAEKDTVCWVIPPEVYRELMEQSPRIANYTNEVMASRFSEVMWLMEQVLWKSFDERLAKFLLEESDLEGSRVLKLTHEAIGNHLGNPREVVTRMLRYFQSEGLVKLSRGSVELTDPQGLKQLIENGD